MDTDFEPVVFIRDERRARRIHLNHKKHYAHRCMKFKRLRDAMEARALNIKRALRLKVKRHKRRSQDSI